MERYYDLESARTAHAKHGGILLEINNSPRVYQIVDFETAVDMRSGMSLCQYGMAAYWAGMGATDFDETRGVVPSGLIGTWVDVIKSAEAKRRARACETGG